MANPISSGTDSPGATGWNLAFDKLEVHLAE